MALPWKPLCSTPLPRTFRDESVDLSCGLGSRLCVFIKTGVWYGLLVILKYRGILKLITDHIN